MNTHGSASLQSLNELDGMFIFPIPMTFHKTQVTSRSSASDLRILKIQWPHVLSRVFVLCTGAVLRPEFVEQDAV